MAQLGAQSLVVQRWASVACVHWVADSATGRAIAGRSGRASVACVHWVADGATGRAIAAVGSAAAVVWRATAVRRIMGAPPRGRRPRYPESWFVSRGELEAIDLDRDCSPVTRANGRASSRRDSHPPRRHTRGTEILVANFVGHGGGGRGGEPRGGSGSVAAGCRHGDGRLNNASIDATGDVPTSPSVVESGGHDRQGF